ncbi:hypothetical protein F6476_13550 [Pseudomonas umsongensis]|uniref:hypothetical protein n=1 Tax=Pseudomonas umsongensis TaxID=198618 RepID=UPI00124440B4|nr:hypothetical protein [Pseudomonas umsongensis]QFG30141.1 hypothetical protein F6476_13550 [Pseudomonas umsongensis]
MLCIPEPILGESLSSWMFRVRLIKRDYTNLSLSENVLRSENLDLRLGYQTNRYLDPDFNFFCPSVELFCKAYSVPKAYLFKYFMQDKQPALVKYYGTAYCYQCMASSIRTVGTPHRKLAWRYVLLPICTVHGTVLNDAPSGYYDLEDAPRQIFRWHTDHLDSRALMWRERAPYEELSALVLRVQNIYAEIRESACAKNHSMLDGFMLTLVRALLMPCADNFYYRRFRNQDSLKYYSLDESWFIRFYHHVFKAGASERAIALCLAGVLLGWVNDQEASILQSVYDREQPLTRYIWVILNKNTRMLSWIKSQLMRNETPSLNLLSLSDQPGCWR